MASLCQHKAHLHMCVRAYALISLQWHRARVKVSVRKKINIEFNLHGERERLYQIHVKTWKIPASIWRNGNFFVLYICQRLLWSMHCLCMFVRCFSSLIKLFYWFENIKCLQLRSNVIECIKIGLMQLLKVTCKHIF